jgi:hypothetical protein
LLTVRTTATELEVQDTDEPSHLAEECSNHMPGVLRRRRRLPDMLILLTARGASSGITTRDMPARHISHLVIGVPFSFHQRTEKDPELKGLHGRNHASEIPEVQLRPQGINSLACSEGVRSTHHS